jgi:predicted Zn-dependent protease
MMISLSSNRDTMLKRIHVLVAAMACAASMTAFAAGSDYNLPDMGQPADTAMTPAQERKVGAQVVYQLRSQQAIVDDVELEAYINRIGRRLARHTDRSPNLFDFYVIKSDQINAFALPGGYIGVNSGLITATDSESELASVMAHEIAHVTQRHIARQIAESRGDTIATMATAIAAAVIGAAAGAGQAVPAAIMGGMSHLGMQQISNTRAHEYEADRVGIRTLARSDFDPTAMARFFEKIQRQSDLYGQQLPQILLTHPVSTTRMAEAESRAKDYPDVPVHVSPDYAYMKERARVLQTSNYGDLNDYYQRRLARSPSAAERYGYALVLGQLGRTRQALPILTAGMKAHPDILAWAMALANAQTHIGDSAQADKILKAALKRFPNRDTPKLAYAQALQAQGQPGAMRNFLISQEHILSTYPLAQELLARGAGDQGKLGEAYYRQARYFAMLDDYPQAINQLRTALQTAKLSPYNTSRLHALRDQMVVACRRAWSESECRRGVKEGNDY